MASNGVARASVKDVSDPAGLGRVQLEPARGPRGGVWAPVATPAAPAVGDEVLVGYEDGDPARPVVIGTLRCDALELRLGAGSVVLGADGTVRVAGITRSTGSRQAG